MYMDAYYDNKQKLNHLFVLQYFGNFEKILSLKVLQKTNLFFFNPAVLLVWFLCLWFHMKI